MTDIPEQVGKTVANFTDTIHTEQQIIDHLINIIYPAVKAEIAAFFAQGNISNGVSTFKDDSDLNGNVQSLGNNIWNVYPKYSVKFSTPQVLEDALSSFSGRMNAIKGIIKNELELFGATDIKFHMHYSDNRTPKVDEF